MDPEAKLVSFVVRFVYEEPADTTDRLSTGWYGVIRHVQSNTERRFVHWEDAVTFIAQYVNVEQRRTE